MSTFPDLIRQHEVARDRERKRAAAAVETVKRLHARAVAEGRSALTSSESQEFEALARQQESANEAADRADSQLEEYRAMHAQDIEIDGRLDTRDESYRPDGARSAVHRNPLAFAPQALDAVQAAIESRTAGRFGAAGSLQERATLVTGTLGAPRVWAANVVSGPRLLHVAAGCPEDRDVPAIFAQIPNLTLPTATGGVAEGVTLSEYAASTAGSVTLARFGRFTDLSRESLIGASADAIIGMHQVGVGKDLDKVLIDAVNTAAGSAVAFSADVPAAIRKSLATVQDNTAAEDAAQLVVICHPDNISLLESVTPVGGQTIAEAFNRFSGAVVYPSSAVPTGFMLVANLQAGARYFEALPVTTETDYLPKTSVLTVATGVIAGYGLGLVGGASGFVQKIDVVTP